MDLNILTKFPDFGRQAARSPRSLMVVKTKILLSSSSKRMIPRNTFRMVKTLPRVVSKLPVAPGFDGR